MTVGDVIDTIEQKVMEKEEARKTLIELEEVRQRFAQIEVAHILYQLPLLISKAVWGDKSYPEFKDLLPEDVRKQTNTPKTPEQKAEAQRVKVQAKEAGFKSFVQAANAQLQGKENPLHKKKKKKQE